MAAGSPFVGQVLNGRYRLVDLVGRGAFSLVFDAVDVSTNKHVAELVNPFETTRVA